MLDKYGLLLESDPRLPSVVSLVAGGPLRGSWWGHPLGTVIFHVSNRLAHRPSVLTVKLVSGKVTFVHRRFWPHLFAIGTSNEPWQTNGLPAEGQRLLGFVRKMGVVRTDNPVVEALVRPNKSSAMALELERRLLVVGLQVHTQSGSHAKSLETWKRWAKRRRVPEKLDVSRAKSELDSSIRLLNDRFRGSGRLPWWE